MPGLADAWGLNRCFNGPPQIFCAALVGRVFALGSNPAGLPVASDCASFVRERKQQTDQRKYLRPETAKRLSPLARNIFDVD